MPIWEQRYETNSESGQKGGREIIPPVHQPVPTLPQSRSSPLSYPLEIRTLQAEG